MAVHRILLNVLNTVLRAVVAVFLLTAALWAAYALWDNAQIYAAAATVRDELLALKPEVEADAAAETTLAAGFDQQTDAFAALKELNPDVQGWLTMDGTAIDAPILQGENNLTYLNTDVYGNFALSGSIFLDSGCDASFQEGYSLLYGHHMKNHLMFGDLDFYKDEDFFQDNTGGTLSLPGRTYHLEVFACMVVSASDSSVYNPALWRQDIGGLLEYVRGHARLLHEDTLERLASTPGAQVLAMSTCSGEFSDARTVVFAAMG